MPETENNSSLTDLLIIGGGVNGCGIARDAVGRGLSVMLVEMNDLASATSSASTKLFHGGLRYLEYFEFRLVREALIERERLLQAMPHISWPMRFVLPYHKDMRFETMTPASRLLNTFMPWMKGRRPRWMIRFGLFLYDHIGGRRILPATSTLKLRQEPEGQPLKARFEQAYEYSDCWIEDARLVALNARDAKERGAMIDVRTRMIDAESRDGLWHVTLEDTDTKEQRVVKARMLVNAAGPWVADIIGCRLKSPGGGKTRLVRGSHIVTRKLFGHDKCYFFQGEDGRIIFAIPYETDFTLIGTTDVEHKDPDTKPVCTDEEKDYLLRFASQYFDRPVTRDDIVWTYSGVRPLYDDGASSATAATRDYVLMTEQIDDAPVLNVFGGKITTYRRLAESALAKIRVFLPGIADGWTEGVPLPGGNFEVASAQQLMADLCRDYPFLTEHWAKRLIRAYGTDAWNLLGEAEEAQHLGQEFAATLTEREVSWLCEREFAVKAEDILWRRSKLGLRFTEEQVAALELWLQNRKTAAKSADTAHKE